MGADEGCDDLNQIGGGQAVFDVVADADNDRNFSFRGREESNDGVVFALRLNLVDKGFEFFRRNVFDDLGDEFDAVDGFEFVRIVGGLVADEFLFRSKICASSFFFSSRSWTTRFSMSLNPAFRQAPTRCRRSSMSCVNFSAAEPVTHSKRRTPAAIALSLTMLK